MKYAIVVIVILFNACIIETHAQKVYKSNDGLFIIDASGLPSAYIKSKTEVEYSKQQPSGITKRHTVMEGNGTNPNVNFKVSPKFAIADQDVLTFNSQTGEFQSTAHWMEASGFEDFSADDNLNETGIPVDRGCAAYQGPEGADAKGSWRLPTARELTLIWTLTDKLAALGYTPLANQYYYWAASEATKDRAYILQYPSGSFIDVPKWNKGRLRCIKDL